MESATAVRLPQPEATGAKPRWYRADNIRWLLCFNVICEHMLTQTGCTLNGAMELIVVWSRMITMPGFCFLSGYFSKKTDKCYTTAISDFLIPYLIFNGLFVLVFGSGTPNFFTPTFLYWYMLCMFFWKIFIRAVTNVKYIIPISFAVALLVGIYGDVGEFLSFSRTLVFLPYFLIGYFMSREQVAKMEKLPKIPVLLVTLVVMGVWGWLNLRYADGSGSTGLLEAFSIGGGREREVLAGHVYDIDFYYNWQGYGYYGFWDSAVLGPMWQGLIMRIAGYLVSGVLIVAFFNLVPDRELPLITGGGRRTMPPYLLHAYVIMNLRYLVEFVPALDRWYIMLPAAVILAVVMMAVLGLPALNDLYNDFAKFLRKFFIREEKKAA